jgi:aryl-phospho-beta-D-glucosidase BglC (GH1 family)
MLRVENGKIVDGHSREIRLQGVCIGGWMNLENFINGYPGSEHGVRAAMVEALGASRAAFFFERLLDHMLAEADLEFLAQLGVNTVRLPFNYRHFESEQAPFQYLESGFARLARAVEWCGRHGLYAILDLHAVPGWQNPDWHSDNGSRQALFWHSRHQQDRFVALWEELARRFAGNAAVAGYNVMNEPVTGVPRGRFVNDYRSDWAPLNAVYRRVVGAIRAIDRAHIIFLEGDLYSTRFSGLEAPFAENLVYSSHNYNAGGFGPGAYPGTIGGEAWGRDKQRRVFEQSEGTRFAREHDVPLWVGEFGSVYNGAPEEVPDRLRALDDQLGVFAANGVHWTAWTYKDVETMGWVMLRSESEYAQRISRVLALKRALGTDSWAGWLPSSDVTRGIERVAELAAAAIGNPELPARHFAPYLKQAALDGFFGGLLQPEYASAFRGLSENELDRVLASFALSQCRRNQPLLELVRKHVAASAAARP